jgi:hypothetical protein
MFCGLAGYGAKDLISGLRTPQSFIDETEKFGMVPIITILNSPTVEYGGASSSNDAPPDIIKDAQCNLFTFATASQLKEKPPGVNPTTWMYKWPSATTTVEKWPSRDWEEWSDTVHVITPNYPLGYPTAEAWLDSEESLQGKVIISCSAQLLPRTSGTEDRFYIGAKDPVSGDWTSDMHQVVRSEKSPTVQEAGYHIKKFGSGTAYSFYREKTTEYSLREDKSYTSSYENELKFTITVKLREDCIVSYQEHWDLVLFQCLSKLGGYMSLATTIFGAIFVLVHPQYSMRTFLFSRIDDADAEEARLEEDVEEYEQLEEGEKE